MMRVLTFGDIHGCTKAWDTLWASVAPTADDQIVTLGDYIDRGPDSRGIIDRLIEIEKQGRLIALIGNHEQMILDARYEEMAENVWLINGGYDALASYEPSQSSDLLSTIPSAHWQFLERCRNWHEIESHLFVHASVEPELPMNQQPLWVLRWRKLHDPRPHISGKTVVCGHTPQRNGLPLDLGHTICIDTFAYGGQYITCLDVLSGNYWQANQQGETRSGRLREPA